IDAKFLHEYSKGIDKQFEEFLNRKLNFKEDFKNPVVDYIKNIKNFWINTQQTKFDVENFPSTDLIIDYCNYVLQTHFRLSNVFKTFKRKNQSNDNRVKIRLNDQILELMYNIMTDSFTLLTSLSIDNSTEKLKMNQDIQSKWGESFEQSFKELKNYLKKECLCIVQDEADVCPAVPPRNHRYAEERVDDRVYLPGELLIIIKITSYSSEVPSPCVGKE
ncbi:hypothetical protein BpHYR1_007444, partial [Brachionus plicatilis]